MSVRSAVVDLPMIAVAFARPRVGFRCFVEGSLGSKV